jgi:hypothetical protein
MVQQDVPQTNIVSPTMHEKGVFRIGPCKLELVHSTHQTHATIASTRQNYCVIVIVSKLNWNNNT